MPDDGGTVGVRVGASVGFEVGGGVEGFESWGAADEISVVSVCPKVGRVIMKIDTVSTDAERSTARSSR